MPYLRNKKPRNSLSYETARNTNNRMSLYNIIKISESGHHLNYDFIAF